MAKRKPRIEYKWSPINEPIGKIVGKEWPSRTVDHEVTWSLYGTNGEYMCGSGSEGYRDKTDARRAVHQSVYAMCGINFVVTAREIGPGKKPQ